MNSVLTPLLAITSWLLGLSVLVQVLQELYKFLSSSKSRAFENALADFLGPFLLARLRQDARLTVRGPLQFRRVSVAGRLLPLNADDLCGAIEKTAPEWQRVVGRALDAEVTLQGGVPTEPSPALKRVLLSLEQQLEPVGADRQSSTFGGADRVAAFLTEWGLGPATPLDAGKVRQAFRQEFFPQFDTVGRHYDQFLQNFGYQYRRRNLRQTFILAFIVTVVLNLPFEQIYVRATTLSPEQAVALATNAQQLYARADVLESTEGAEKQNELRAVADQALAIARSATDLTCGPRDAGLATEEITAAARDLSTTDRAACKDVASVDYLLDPEAVWTSLTDGRLTSVRYLFGCLISTVLIAFGAPFWNDVSASLLRVAKPGRQQHGTAATDRPISTEVE